MFDPTAFENIKVVIEGTIYDRDLDGDLVVIDRNDWVNTAKLSRKYEIAFALSESNRPKVTASIILEAELENLAAEMLDNWNGVHHTGCKVSAFFRMDQLDDIELYSEIQEVLEGIWGRGRTIEQIISHPPKNESLQVRNTAKVTFNRLVSEDQIDDLAGMIDFMILSVEKLEGLITK